MRYLLALVLLASCDSPSSDGGGGDATLTWGLTAEERVAACEDGMRIMCGGDFLCGLFDNDEQCAIYANPRAPLAVNDAGPIPVAPAGRDLRLEHPCPGRCAMRIGYADPPYPGCAHLYAGHADYAGEVDHAALIARLEAEYDGWVLHTSASPKALKAIVPLLPDGARMMSWVKGFAAFKRNVSVAYAWEPVIVKAARKPVVSKRLVMRDWIECPITLRRGLVGAKPEKVCHWAFEMVGARPEDDLDDMFPGTGAVGRAWDSWRKLFLLPLEVASSRTIPPGVPQ